MVRILVLAALLAVSGPAFAQHGGWGGHEHGGWHHGGEGWHGGGGWGHEGHGWHGGGHWGGWHGGWRGGRWYGPDVCPWWLFACE